MHILIVEDEQSISDPLAAGLKRDGFTTTVVHLASTALQELSHKDLLILDLGLPDMDGIELLKQIRRISDIPIIILTARGDEMDRIIGLELGADDYVVKPFSLRELITRVKVISKRRTSSSFISTKHVVLDRGRREVKVDGSVVELATKEFDILAILLEEPGRVVPRQEFFSRVWDTNWYGSGKTLDVHMNWLRKKLGNSEFIETVRGIGYRFVDDHD